MSERVAIVIPVYKRELAWNEEISFRQTLRVLGNHPIIMVCPETLDLAKYNAIAGEYNRTIYLESFEDRYFANIAGYNRLLLSEEFYARFERYEYILIAQLDTYVFRDELTEWCNKGYDYIGAPLFGAKWDAEKYVQYGQVGNGGLSLRRVVAYLNFFRGNQLVVPLNKIAERIRIQNKIYTRWLVWILMAFGWRNKPHSYAKYCHSNEDGFWSITLDGTNYELTKPSVEEALEFAWERFPSDIYKKVGHLPMGCHAWEKYEYESFWNKYLIDENLSNIL